MLTTFYVYFKVDDKQNAERMKNNLEAKKYSVLLDLLDYKEGTWSLKVNHDCSDIEDMNNTEEIISDIANKYGGEYDGNEVEV